MYNITFEDGERIEAWPEELHKLKTPPFLAPKLNLNGGNKMKWRFNTWKKDARWDDCKHAEIEALRAIAEQLEKLNQTIEKIATQGINTREAK
jgi:hypothetical protein